MLQGSSTDEIAHLVESLGGEITHRLNIIDAVGAKLPADQLDTVLANPVIGRHIDDMDLPDEVEKPLDFDCKVRGHIELTIGPDQINWGLYNKMDSPALLSSISASWPKRLGPAKAVYVGEQKIPLETANEQDSESLTLSFAPGKEPTIEGESALRITFGKGTFHTDLQGNAQAQPSQSDFELEAAFTEGCSTELVPGYTNNQDDYYYNSVAGIDALHMQQVTGRGVTIAVIDSGLWDHPNLLENTQGKSRVLARYDALADREVESLHDGSGHGTHMTSIAAHSGATIRNGKPTGWYKGVAPDADIVAVKVLDREGRAHLLDIVRAVQWVVDNREKYNIRVLNLSFSQLPRWPYWDDPVNQAVMRAWHSGIAVVAAAGNDGPDQMTVGSPGNLPYVITVGAVTDSWTPDTRDDDYVPDFSSRGPTPTGHIKPDIVALGGHITGLINHDSALATGQPEDLLSTGEFVSTGSSQAAALISGYLAILLQLEPQLTPDDLKCKLITSAEPAINRDGSLAYSPFVQGYGYASITRAITLGKRGCGNDDLDLEADIARTDFFYGPARFDDNDHATLPDMEQMLSTEPTEKGLSESRRWGVKEHVEREGYSTPTHPTGVDWEEIYRAEKATIERLARPE